MWGGKFACPFDYEVPGRALSEEDEVKSKACHKPVKNTSYYSVKNPYSYQAVIHTCFSILCGKALL